MANRFLNGGNLLISCTRNTKYDKLCFSLAMREILNTTNSISVHEIGRFSTTMIVANDIEIK